MSGWDETRRVNLDPPWDSFYIDLWEDPPIGAWLDFRETVGEALSSPVPELINAALMAMRPLIAAHNLTDRDGTPIALDMRVTSVGLVKALITALTRAVEGAGTAVPLGSRATSPAASSRASRRRRASSSGSSRKK